LSHGNEVSKLKTGDNTLLRSMSSMDWIGFGSRGMTIIQRVLQKGDLSLSEALEFYWDKGNLKPSPSRS
jgi:hypothetical protein